MVKLIVLRCIEYFGKYSQLTITLKLAKYSHELYMKLIDRINPSGDNSFEKNRFNTIRETLEFSQIVYEEVDIVSGHVSYIRGYIRGLEMADKYSDVCIKLKYLNAEGESSMDSAHFDSVLDEDENESY